MKFTPNTVSNDLRSGSLYKDKDDDYYILMLLNEDRKTWVFYDCGNKVASHVSGASTKEIKEFIADCHLTQVYGTLELEFE